MTCPKAYVVVEYGGQWEDSYERIIGVCTTSEVAEALKSKVEKMHDKSGVVISKDEWEEMWDVLLDEPLSGVLSEAEEMHRLFPKYSKEEIEAAAIVYDDYPYSDYIGVRVDEVDLYNQLSDISNNNGFNN